MNEEDVAKKYFARIRYRLHKQNKNWLAIICGETGSGKSYSALSIGEAIGRVFVVFTALEFMTLINSGKLQRGDVVVFDEAGVGMSAREWYSTQNKVLGAVLQTFRNMNIAVIFTTPNLSFVDVQARKLFHAYLETAYLDQEEELAYLKAYEIQVNSRYDKIYYKNPRFTDEKGCLLSMSHLAVSKPSEDLVKSYEERKLAYTQKLNLDALKELRGDNLPEKKPKIDKDELVQKVLKNKKEFIRKENGRPFIDRDKVMNSFGVGEFVARKVKKAAELALFSKDGGV